MQFNKFAYAITVITVFCSKQQICSGNHIFRSPSSFMDVMVVVAVVEEWVAVAHHVIF